MITTSSPATETALTGGIQTAWERGKLLRLAGRSAESLSLLRREVRVVPNDYRLHDEMGMALSELGRQEEAIGEFLTALRLNPGFGEVCGKIGRAFALRGLLEPARLWFERAQQHDPDATDHLHYFGTTLVALGELSEAAKVFARWTAAEPDNPVARHLADAAIGSGVTERAPTGYVRALFDGYASRFDECLARLNYCGPQLVHDTLRRFAMSPEGGWSVLDAGCGTGLVGTYLRPLARRMVGVDLSTAMLDVARRRNVYDELVEAEVVEYLAGQSRVYDVVTAADVLTYLGELEGFFQSVARVLLPNGLVVVTVEALNGQRDYQLNATGRFSHSPQYLSSVMQRAGLVVKFLNDAVMRREADRPVLSLVAVGSNSTE